MKAACEKAYKSDPSNIVSKEEEANDSTKFWDVQVWENCSLLLAIPKTLKDVENQEGDDKTKILNNLGDSKVASDKKEELLAIFASDNKSAWEAINFQRIMGSLRRSSDLLSRRK